MSDSVRVVVKVRPRLAREEAAAPELWRVGRGGDTLQQLDTGTTYTFDKVYDEHTKTLDVYNDIAKPIVEATTAGINGTIFAYGQTSSGKTYTMLGEKDSLGIIPLAIYDIFDRINNIPGRDFLIRVSFIEIYNETIKDLLNDNKQKIKISETLDGSVKIDATEKVTSSAEEVLDVMKQGEVNRQVGATNMNEKSSRSHTIFQITIESREHTEEEDDTGCVNVSQLNLVDLAGSERAGQTGATGVRFKEGTHINKSLSALGLVIMQLSEDPNKFVNYRDSKLTRILRNSLGGNAKTGIICAVTPAALEETISTLQFANRAKAIKNKPEVNAVATNATMLQSLTKKLAHLQYELDSKKHIEHDNEVLMKKIEQLQKQILFGNEIKRSSTAANRRKTWCAPRRATISVLDSIREDDALVIPAFCTPTLKYNPYDREKLENVTMHRPPDIPEGDEDETASSGQVTPPPRKKNVNFTDEVIELDDSDDENGASSQTCSPYHRCYASSKTPPCVLREKAKSAEQNYTDLMEFTQLEKIYTPTTGLPSGAVKKVKPKIKKAKTLQVLKKPCKSLDVSGDAKTANSQKVNSRLPLVKSGKSLVELIEKLDQAAKDMAAMREDGDLSREKLKNKDEEIECLKDKISTYVKEIEDNNSNKVELIEKLDQAAKDMAAMREDGDLSREKLKNKDEEIECLKDKISTYVKEIEDNNSNKVELESLCEKYKTKVNDLEVCLDSFRTKAKLREEELLSLLEEKSHGVGTIALEKTSMRPHAIELSAFMNLSKDISLIDSDVESSIIQHASVNEEKTTIYDELKDLQLQITEKNKLINELYKKITNGQQSIQILNKELESSNATINYLRETIDDLRVNLRKADDDMESDDLVIQELKNKINDADSTYKEEQQKVSKELVRSEEKMLKNNEEISKVVDTLKQVLLIKSEEIKQLKSENRLCAENCQNVILSKDKIIRKLEEELVVLKQIASTDLQDIVKSSNVKNKLFISNQNIQAENKQLSDGYENKTADIVILTSKHNEAQGFNTLENVTFAESEEIKRLKADLDLICSNHTDLTEKHNELVGKHDACQSQNNLLCVQIEELKEKLIKKKDEMQLLSHSENELRTALTRSKEELEKNVQSAYMAETMMAKCTNELESLRHKAGAIEEIQEKSNKLVQSIKQKNAEISELKSFIIELEIRLKEKIQNEEKLRDQVEKILSEPQSKLVRKEAENAELHSRIIELENEIKGKTQKEKELSEIIYSLQKLKHDLSQKETLIFQLNAMNTDLEVKLNDKCLKESELHSSLDGVNLELVKKDSWICTMEQRAKKLFKKIYDQSFETKAIDSDNFVLMLDTIDNHLTLMKQKLALSISESCQDIDVASELKKQLALSNITIDELQIKITSQENEIQVLQNTCQKRNDELNQLVELNRDANNNVLECEDLIKTLKEELVKKTDQLEVMCAKLNVFDNYITDKMDKYEYSITVLEDKHQLIRKELCKQTSGSALANIENTGRQFISLHVKNTPPSLKQISLKKVTEEVFQYFQHEKIKRPCKVESDEDFDSNCNEISVDKLRLKNENKELLQKIGQLQKSNTQLELDMQQLNKEVKLLLEPADELYKQISKHRTHFATLTATTYAENKLLKAKVKALHHHHDRLHNICRREIPDMRQQLQEVYSILQTEFSSTRRSLVHKENETNSCPEAHNETSFSRCSGISLGSDALMLGNNFTLGPSANSTMIDLDELPNSTIYDNLDVTEIPRGIDNGCQTDSKMLDPSIDKNVMPSCCSVTGEARISNDQQDCVNLLSPFDGLLEKELKQHKDNCIIRRKFHILVTELETKLEALEQKSTDVKKLEQENYLLEERCQKVDGLRNEGLSEIKVLTSKLHSMQSQLQELQAENETLSNDIMDGIIESDSLKERLQKLQGENAKYMLELANLATESDKKNEAIDKTTRRNHDASEYTVPKSDKCTNPGKQSPGPHISEKLLSLPNEIVASQEHCMESNTEMATMRIHPSSNDNLSFEIKDNLEKSNIPLALSSQCSAIYTDDKKDCINFLKDKDICDKHFDKNMPIIDMMNILYDTLSTAHSNKVENLINRLKDFEEDKIKYDVQIKFLTEECDRVNIELKTEQNFHSCISKQLNFLQENNALIQEECTNLDKLEDVINTKCIKLFSQKLLEPLDKEFSLTTSETFKMLVSDLQCKFEQELLKSNNRCMELENQTLALTEDLNKVKNKLILMEKSIVDQNEKELVLLKCKFEKVTQISKAVTLDLIRKDKELKTLVAQKYQELIDEDVISDGDINISLPPVEIIDKLFFFVNLKQRKDIMNLTQKLNLIEIENKQLTEDLRTNNINLDEFTNEVLLKKNEIEVLEKQNVCLDDKIKSLSLELKDKEKQAHKSSLESIEVYENAIKKLENENIILKSTKQKLDEELSDSKKNLSDCKIKIGCLENGAAILRNENKLLNDQNNSTQRELLEKVELLESECDKLRYLNAALTKENADNVSKLQLSMRALEENKEELVKMITKLEEARQSHDSLLSNLNKLKQERIAQDEKFAKVNENLNDKGTEITRLQNILKSHQKSADAQTSSINRLQKEMGDLEITLKDKGGLLDEKEAVIEELTTKFNTLLADVNQLNNLRDMLELRITELQREVDAGQKSSRNSLGSVKSEARRRRQSLYDLRRTYADNVENESPEHEDVQDMFGSRQQPDDLFSDTKSVSQRNSTDSSNNFNHKTAVSATMKIDSMTEAEGDEMPRDSTAMARRIRRQSLHDQHRSPVTSQLHGAKYEEGEIEKLQAQNESLQDRIGKLEATIESGPTTDEYCKDELKSLKDNLESTRKQYEELSERYKELDEECDTCALYLREREEQCVQLTLAKKALEGQLAEMTKCLEVSNDSSSRTPNRQPSVDIGVNTESDWSKLHSVVVDRTSYDAEVDKNRKLTRAAEELRAKYEDMKTTVIKLQKKLAECAPNKTINSELVSLKSELASTKRQYEELSDRYKELDEECETCASYLRQRETQCLELKKANTVLEARVSDLQHSLASPIVQSARKKRQSCHDQNRDSQIKYMDASTNTNEGALTVIGIDKMTFEAEKEKRRKLQGVLEELKARNAELVKELRRLQQQRHGADESTVGAMLGQGPPGADLHAHNLQIQQFRMQVEELQKAKARLEAHVCALVSAPPAAPHAPHATPLAAPLAAQPAAILVATGSAIVQNQQLCEFMKENQQLKKINEKLVKLCRKRGKLGSESNRENRQPE